MTETVGDNAGIAGDDTLAALYPWQHDQPPADAAGLRRQLSAAIQRKAADSLLAKQHFFHAHGDAVLAAADALARVFAGGGRLFTMGNGGSACDAAHIAVEFSHPVTTGRPALPALHLGADSCMLTAVANDVGSEHIFVRQLIAQARAGDALIGVSTSGNSANLMAAFARAREQGLLTIGLAGGDGGAMAQDGALDHCLTVAADSVHRVQETHVAIYHILWDLVHSLLASLGEQSNGGGR